jgi:predicted transcriptional regulator
MGIDNALSLMDNSFMPMTRTELRKRRKHLGLTQKQMADRVGVHWNSLARMERGEMTISEPVARLVRFLVVHPELKR